MPAADPLDRSRCPMAGCVPGAATGRRDRPFQGRRDLPQRPAENPAAPNQHHHLVIVFADQLSDPLTVRDAAGGGQCIKSLIGGFSRFRSNFTFANPGKQTKAPESSGSRSAFFSFPRAPGPQNRLRQFGEIPAPPRVAGGARMSPRVTLVRLRQANIGPPSASFFSGSSANRPIGRNPDQPGARGPVANTAEAVHGAGGGKAARRRDPKISYREPQSK